MVHRSEPFGELPKDALNKADVTLDANSATFGGTKINYADVEDLVFNSSSEGTAAAVINVRSRERSPISGLERHKILEFEFAPDAKDLAEAFVNLVGDLNIRVKKTDFANTTFRRAFFGGKSGA
jgi:hypothetical protein